MIKKLYVSKKYIMWFTLIVGAVSAILGCGANVLRLFYWIVKVATLMASIFKTA